MRWFGQERGITRMNNASVAELASRLICTQAFPLRHKQNFQLTEVVIGHFKDCQESL